MFNDFRAVADGEPKIHLVGIFFGEQNRENFVVDQALDLRRRGGEDLIEVQRRINFLADVRKDRERLGGNLRFRIELS